MESGSLPVLLLEASKVFTKPEAGSEAEISPAISRAAAEGVK
jgi:hypothetical protein